MINIRGFHQDCQHENIIYPIQILEERGNELASASWDDPSADTGGQNLTAPICFSERPTYALASIESLTREMASLEITPLERQ